MSTQSLDVAKLSQLHQLLDEVFLQMTLNKDGNRDDTRSLLIRVPKWHFDSVLEYCKINNISYIAVRLANREGISLKEKDCIRNVHIIESFPVYKNTVHPYDYYKSLKHTYHSIIQICYNGCDLNLNEQMQGRAMRYEKSPIKITAYNVFI